MTQRHNSNIRITAALALGLLAACSDSLGLDESRRLPGILQIVLTTAPTGLGERDPAIRWSDPPSGSVLTPPAVIEAPDTVNAGQAFEITVYTIGPTGCWAADGADVHTGSTIVHVTPWDRHSGAEVCSTVLSYLERSVMVTLLQPGEWTIRASGRRARDTIGNGDVAVTAERTIFVRTGS